MTSLTRMTPIRAARRGALLLLLALLAGLPAGPAMAGSILPSIAAARQRPGASMSDVDKHYVQVADGIWLAVKGRRERRQVRYSRLWSVWSDDQRRVATELGFPVNRLLEIGTGTQSETWSYPEHHVRIVFDDEGRERARHAN